VGAQSIQILRTDSETASSWIFNVELVEVSPETATIPAVQNPLSLETAMNTARQIADSQSVQEYEAPALPAVALLVPALVAGIWILVS
jgi:hypothetical protein